MRLITCRIENFGKLSDLSLDFSEGLHAIIEDNGWGKSTLAAFIKVMFFGFSGERTLDDVKNERKRYTPWQGGVYGGSLTFETKGKTYTMTRSFGKKEKEDVFELRDTKTNLLSQDYSEYIGEELFRIDGDSFLRTIYISQNDCKSGTTDSINAKLGNLADHTDDINNFETVIERFQSMLNKMSPRRKTGTLAIRKSQIVEAEQETRLATSVDAAIAELQSKRDAKKTEYEQLRKQKAELEAKQAMVQKEKDLQATRETYRMLCENLKVRERELEQAGSHFPGTMPKEKDLISYGQMSQKLLKATHAAEHYRLTPNEEELVSKGMPTEEEIDSCLDIYPQLQEMDKKIVAETVALQALIGAQKGNKKGIVFAIGGILGVAGIAMLILSVIPVGVLLLLVGAAVLLYGVLSGDRKVDNTRVSEQEAKVQKMQDERVNLYQHVVEKISPYTSPEALSEGRLFITLQDLRRNAQKHSAIQEKKRCFEEAQQERIEGQKKVEEYLQSLSIFPEVDMVSQFAKLREHLSFYERIQKSYELAKREKESFEAKNDVSDISVKDTTGSLESLTDIGEQIRLLASQMDALHHDAQSYERQLEGNREKRDAISEKEEELATLRELQEKEQKQLELITKTKELMEQAKATFTQKYMAPIMNGFEKYYGMLTGKTAQDYYLDANANLTTWEKGQQRETRFLSAGYQDLLGICMRLALVDAMYQEEKPFILMDDPFVNLDNKKIDGGLSLLREVAKEYQVVYFSCHKSRV